ncbi:MAG: hypothetical protein LBS57_13700 [Treponema sp.]|jgi:hypothetical protein|nr:hypothetical protein [Treponema sp.]
MKRIFQLIITGLVTAGLFAACVPPFEPELNERYNLQSEKSGADLGITVSSVTAAAAPLIVQPQTDMAAYPQRIILQVATSKTANTSNFDIGTADKKIKGLSIYPLKAGTDNYTLYVEGDTALDYTAYPIGKNQVELQLPFTEADLKPAANPTSWLILKFDPIQVTFNGGKGKLNTDGDTLPGEAEEDFFALYYTNVRPAAAAGYPAPTQGMKYANTLTVTAGTIDSDFLHYGGSSVKISGFSIPTSLAAGAYNTPFDPADLIKAYRFEKFDRQTGNWKPLVPGNPAFTAGVLTLNFSTGDAPEPLDIVRYMVDPYLIVSTARAGGLTNGTTLRASYNQFLHKTIGDASWTYSNVMDTNPASTPYLTIPGVTALATTPTISVSGAYRSYYVDLTVVVNGATVVANSTLLDLDSLRQAASAGTGMGTGQTAAARSNIRIFQVNGTGNPGATTGKIIREISFDRGRIELKSPTEFRIHLPRDYGNYSSGAYLEIHIINASATFRSGIDTKTAAFWKPNGAVDHTGSYRFRVKGPAVP